MTSNNIIINRKLKLGIGLGPHKNPVSTPKPKNHICLYT